jgi:hypothetical protein
MTRALKAIIILYAGEEVLLAVQTSPLPDVLARTWGLPLPQATLGCAALGITNAPA